eukprot:TRINITY_DN8507_c0_g2_i1.p1 TRINITY_DN8507_c0_g2~~TRINITY_DN8507_c0_g2_i1.p1  ORF type:complete len:304 (-),score=26.04 TRINITY_DN8507_c0_g2_i1:209-1120(-)
MQKNACSLPPSLKLKAPNRSPNAVKDPNSKLALLHSLSNSAARKTTPFLWLHWGDTDFMTLSAPETASSQEGSDLTSQCVVDGLKDAFFGDSTPPDHVIEALGAFFLCKETHRSLYESFESLLQTKREQKFDFFDDFYFPIGNESSHFHDSWVNAAKMGKRPIVVVGPKRLSSLHCMLQHQAFLEFPMPTVGCDDAESLIPQMTQLSKTRFPDQSVVFAISGGVVGRLIAYKAYKVLGAKDIFIDVGASLDAYVGVHDRDYNMDSSPFCKESKSWMSYDACKSYCSGIREDFSCRECKSFVTG